MTHPSPGSVANESARISHGRLCAYLLVAIWLGVTVGTLGPLLTSGRLLVGTVDGAIGTGLFVALLVMWWRDDRCGRIGGQP